MDETHRDRDAEGRARNARPGTSWAPAAVRDARGGAAAGGVIRSPDETLREAQRLLDAGMPFHAHEVFEDAWKSGPEEERELWRGLAQLAVGLTHSARGNTTGGARLLRRGAAALAECAQSGGFVEPGEFGDAVPYGIGVHGLIDWAQKLAGRVEAADAQPVDAAEVAPCLRPERR